VKTQFQTGTAEEERFLVYAGKSEIILSLVLCSPLLVPGQWWELDGEVYAVVMSTRGFSHIWTMIGVTWKTRGPATDLAGPAAVIWTEGRSWLHRTGRANASSDQRTQQ